MRTLITITTTIIFLLSGVLSTQAEVRLTENKQRDGDILYIADVSSNETWQPESFEAFPILHAPLVREVPVIDGLADDPAWANAKPLILSLGNGTVAEATLKAVYTDKEIFLLVSWPDASKDDQHRPWLWNDKQGRYVEGPQVEDGLLVSIEEGCDWSPSPLTGHIFDFDGWRWMAARTDPLGQAVDTNGHAQTDWDANMGFTKYQRRGQEPHWNMRFAGRGKPGDFNKSWQELKREYIRFPFDGEGPEMYISMEPDMNFKRRHTKIEFVKRLPAPGVDPEAVKAGQTPEPVVPQFQPVKLEGNAGDVAAKGHWADGRWTVEFRRALITPAKTASDSMFDRTTQFSVHVFDSTERLDEAGESGRIMLEFEPGPESGIESDNLAQNH
jgi:hypothetical protein